MRGSSPGPVETEDPLTPALSPAKPGEREKIPVRVCFVIDDLGRAGTETQLLALIRALDRREVEPSLVLLNGTSPASRELEPADCPVLRLGVTSLTSRRALAAGRELLRFWHRPPEVLQAYFLDASYFTVPLAKLAGVKKIVRVRNNLGYWLTPRHRLLNRLVARGIDVQLTNSDDGRTALAAADRVPMSRVHVIENGVDLDRFAGFDPPLFLPSPLEGEGPGVRGEIRIGCVANLRPVKNLDGLLRAAQLVCDARPDVRFAVAGDGPQRAELLRLRDSLNLTDQFAFVGGVADVPGFLKQLDVFVLPSHSEGLSNALLEAMAAGRAVVATDVGASRSVVGDAGVIVPPGDPVLLAGALLRLLDRPAEVVALGDAARRRVAARYGRAAMTRRVERFYRHLVGRRAVVG